MVGDWVDEGSDSVVRLACRWSEDENFLIRTFTVRQQGKPVMTVHQRIGWDPLARQIRSWEFDSEGGFGEGKWSRAGQRWVIKHEGVRPEGTTASATNIMTQVRPDLIRWVSTERILGDESVPVDETYVLVRVAPPPQLQFPGPATSSIPEFDKEPAMNLKTLTMALSALLAVVVSATTLSTHVVSAAVAAFAVVESRRRLPRRLRWGASAAVRWGASAAARWEASAAARWEASAAAR